MSIQARLPSLLLALLSFAAPASAQLTTTAEGISLSEALAGLTGLPSERFLAPIGQGIGLATALEVATAPTGSSAGAFVFKADPSTGLLVRTATTFGPSFAERALTVGEGKISVSANLSVATYDRLNKVNLREFQISQTTGQLPSSTVTGMASLVMSAETVMMTGVIGAKENLDIIVSVPMVKVKLDGVSWVETADGVIAKRAEGGGIASGLGDIGVGAKFRFLKFGEDQPDPGGLAFLINGRLPTGNRENFRGLGIVRVLGQVLFSSGKGKLRPHANLGFEWWEKGVGVPSIPTGISEARHQIQYAFGVEFEAGPKLTLLADLLGRHILNGGRIEEQIFDVRQDPVLNPFLVTNLETLVPTRKDIRKLTLAPGLKWNLKGAFVASFNALIPLRDNGLHDRFTPVVGLDWTF